MSAPRTIPGRRRASVQIEAAEPRVLGLRLRQCRLRQDACAGAARDPSAAARRRSGARFSASPSPRRPPPTWRTGCSTGWPAGPRSTTPRSTTQIALRPARKPDAAQRARARRLFASALETPGGLKVQTIHAFCTRLLHQFPFEANVAARFTVLDEASTTQIARQVDAGRAARSLGQAGQRARPGAGNGHRGRRRPDLQGRDRAKPSASATRVDAWIERAGGCSTRRWRSCRRRSASAPNETPRDGGSRNSFPHSLIPAAEWPALIEILESGSKTDNKHIAALNAAQASAGARTHRKLSRKSSARPNARRARTSSPRRSPTNIPTGWRGCDRAGARLRAGRARARARRARPHRRADHHRRRRDRALPPRKGPPRPARLRRPDRQDAGAVRALVRRLGALQARPRHRPRADRRGAGHQPQAMGDRAHHRRRIHAGRRAAERAAHDVRGRRREAVDLLVPGRGAARLRRDAARFRQPVRRARAEAGVSCASTTRSAPARTCSAAVDTVFGAREVFASLTADEVGMPPSTRRCPTPRPAWSRMWALIEPAERNARSKAGTRRSTPRARPARACMLARRIAGTVKRWMARRAQAGRRAGPGAPARAAVRGDHPRAEECRASRSPAPTGWC